MAGRAESILRTPTVPFTGERADVSSDASGAAFVHRLFEAQAERRPTAPAIVSGESTLSYREVDERSNQLARHLRSQGGVATRDLVGLFLERSPDAILAVLSILKAGAAYVPLDPSHPADRLRHIIGEAGIRTLVTDRDSKMSASRLGVRVVEIDDPSAPSRSQSSGALSDDEVGLRPADLSYVLYTSGSTGRPKGVMTEHRNVVSFVAAFNRVLRLTSEDRVFHGFSLGFDGSVEEMWMAFSNGAALVVPPRGAPRFGNDLALLIGAGRATVFSTVPTSLSMMSDPLPTVRLLIVSGERCSKELVNRWATSGRRMLNVYGPTETTVNATAAECGPEREVTIGRPLPGYEIHILDEEGRPVAPGQKGELYIAGPGVSRGYLGQPQLTSKHFVRLPGSGPGDVDAGAASETSRRAYRTGDLVSLGEGGELLFFGRTDNQVKVRGYRIELSEIEAVLGEDKSVRSAVVTLVERDGTTELAAHVTAEDAARGVDRARILSLLSSRLPSYMVPAFLDVLAAMPTLASGKVDRRCLPAPATRLIPHGRVIREPRDDLEAGLVSVFGGIFKSDSISIDDDFFLTLGGYSLLAARLVSQLRRELDIEVAIRDVYEHPTIDGLAAHLRSKRAAALPVKSANSSGIQRVSSRPAYHALRPSTRIACTAVQMLGVYLLYGVMALPFVGWFLSWTAWQEGAISSWSFAATSLLVSAAAWPALLALSIAVKWLVIGRYKAGAYPLWGWYYIRFWLVRHFEGIALPGLLAGTPLLPLYYRLMGARVGPNCTIDTVHCAIFDLVSIGEETSIGSETQLLGYHVEDGLLRIGSIDLGKRCFVGIHSALGLNVRMGDDARLDDLSLLPDGSSISAGESRRGSPAEPAEVSVPAAIAARASRLRRTVFGVLHLAVIYALGMAFLPTLLPSAALLWFAGAKESTLRLAGLLPAAGVLGMVTFCLWIALLKCLILPRVRPGIYRVESALYLRKWAVDLLMKASRTLAKPLYTTIYLPPWLRLLGARIGRRAEISTVSQISPELTEIGDQSFFADGSIIGGRRCHRGVVELARSRIGRRSFVGNSAILPVGRSLGDRCLLGCLSAPPAGVGATPDGTEWLGSPSFALPYRRKIEGFDESVTHEPTRKLIAQRLAVDALRIAIPSSVGALELGLLRTLVALGHAQLSSGVWLLSVPAAAMASAAVGLLCVVATKKILIGTFRPTIQPLWSMFVWLNEAVNGAYETVAAPLLAPLLGTPFCAFWLRLLGCKIGRHVYLDTTLFSEFDLVTIGDYAALNAGAIIQNHLFEDRIMKASHLNVGDECCVGGMAVVLYDTEMQRGSSVGPLSLLMKGETLPPDTRWIGIPTAQVPIDSSPALSPVPARQTVGQRATALEGWS
jgi:non-ribosomal peptide synthetase-like protein